MSTESQAPASCCGGHSAGEPSSAESPVTVGSGHCRPTGAEHPLVEADGRQDLLAGGADATTCPVMVGSPVSKKAAEAQGLFRDFDGNRYWFCCAGCGPAFDSDPARYAANMA